MALIKKFSQQFCLSLEQEEQFRLYCSLLQAWNDRTNLTAITQEEAIINDHFVDSLSVTKFFDFSKRTSLADIGAGAGFPGIPLKIMYPHLGVVLIEVNNKKIAFLEHVVAQLGLKEVDIYTYDWRTFLRKAEYEIDTFVARASLQIPELLRMFNASSPYKNAELLYWASRHWQAEEKEQPFVAREEWYEVNGKQRKIVFFRNNQGE